MNLLLKIATSLAICIFLSRAIEAWLNKPSLTLTLLIAGELVTLAIYLANRKSMQSSFGLIPTISTLVGTFGIAIILLDSHQALAPLYITSSLQIIAIIWQIASKISLGRSFGLLPANRGVVTRGTYKLVRHPIYLGYLAGHIAFLLASFSWYNLAIFSAIYFFQGLRIWEEERVLSNDFSYVQYKQKVRYRLVPGLF